MPAIKRRAVLRLGFGAAAAAGVGFSFGSAIRDNGNPRSHQFATAVNAVQQGVSNTGAVDVRSSIQSVVDDFGGTHTIYFPRGRYRIGRTGQVGSNRITLPSHTHIVCERGAVFEVNALDQQPGTSIFYAAGHEGEKLNMLSDTTSGSRHITLPHHNFIAYSPGDLVGIESNAIVAMPADGSDDPAALGGGPGRAREIRKVISVSGNVLEIEIPLEYEYLVEDDAQTWKIHPVTDIALEGMVFEPGPGVSPGSDATYPIQLRRTLNCRLKDIEMHNMIGGIILLDAYDTHIDGLNGNRLPREDSAAGYVLAAAGSTTNLVVDRLRGRESRHLFTTLADQRGGDPYYVAWGGPMFVEVNGAIGFGGIKEGTAVFDTHSYGRHITFKDCVAYGGAYSCAGFQMRAQKVAMINCSAYHCGRQGVNLANSSREIHIKGGQFLFNKAQGMQISGQDHTISNARIHHNAAAGIAYFFDTCVGLVIDGCEMIENKYGLHDGGDISGSLNTLVMNSSCPKGETQTISILNASDTSIIRRCQFLGYGLNLNGAQGSQPGAEFMQITADRP